MQIGLDNKWIWIESGEDFQGIECSKYLHKEKIFTLSNSYNRKSHITFNVGVSEISIGEKFGMYLQLYSLTFQNFVDMDFEEVFSREFW